MAFELLLIVMILLFGVILVQQERLTRTHKIVLSLCAAALIASMMFYEGYQSDKNKNDRLIIMAFKQGKTLLCNNVAVDAKRFIFVSGTLNFMPKDTNEKDRGIVIDISTCKIQP